VSNAQWWKESVVYQIYPRSFKDSNGDGIGDLRGVIEKLDYLQYLGIDMVWICPMFDSPNDDNGYDIRDYRAILAEFGTMDDMLELIEEAKQRGIKIMLDFVANHTSDEHAWFVESKSSKDNPKRDWYIWKPGKNGEEPTNWESFFSGSTWEYDAKTDEYYFHAFAVKQPDLNWENPEVRKAMFDIMHWWMDRGVAGFRLDAITSMKKNQEFPDLTPEPGRKLAPLVGAVLNQPGIMDFLQEMKHEVLLPRGAVSVAEAPGVPMDQIPDYIDEEKGAFNMIFQFDHVDIDFDHLQKGVFKPWKLSAFKKILSNWQQETAESSWLALFLENHDHVRSVSKYGNDKQYRVASAKALAAYYFLMKGTPYIYQGQEIGMTNTPFNAIEEYNDIQSVNMYNTEMAAGRPEQEIMDYLAVRSRDHGRTPIQWNTDANGGFTTGKPWLKVNPNFSEINVEQQIKDEDSILNFYRQLIQVRKANKALIHGRFEDVFADSDQLAGYTRTLDDEKWIVLSNLSEEVVAIPAEYDVNIALCNYKHHQKAELQPYETIVAKL
jgi:oligo-1,6-glucosidase/alpha-glucosidase